MRFRAWIAGPDPLNNPSNSQTFSRRDLMTETLTHFQLPVRWCRSIRSRCQASLRHAITLSDRRGSAQVDVSPVRSIGRADERGLSETAGRPRSTGGAGRNTGGRATRPDRRRRGTRGMARRMVGGGQEPPGLNPPTATRGSRLTRDTLRLPFSSTERIATHDVPGTFRKPKGLR